MMAAGEYYIFTGREVVLPRHVTHVRIDKSLTVIPARAFHAHPNITELVCHDGVKKVEEWAFDQCPSLRRVIMPGVKEVEENVFYECKALMDVECGKLEIIGEGAFDHCYSLRSIDLSSVMTVEELAFYYCRSLTNIKFGDKLESIGAGAFRNCTSLERITIPLKDGMITDNDIFRGCEKMKHVDLVGGVHETIAALLLEGWKNVMSEEIDAINQILPTTPAGGNRYLEFGEIAQAVRLWIRSVLRNIIDYIAQHHRYLNEAANTLQLALPSDIVFKNVLPFLELPSYTFHGED